MKKRPSSFTVIVIFIALALVGAVLMPLLPVKLAPSRSLPSLMVSYSMQGASARMVEAEVTSRIEAALTRMRGVKDISSTSSGGQGRVTINLDRHANLEMARFEASTLVRQIWSEFPDGVSYPEITPEAISDDNTRPFMTYRLNAPVNPANIQSYGEEHLKPIIARIPGVSKVELSGAYPMEWRLNYDIDKLSVLGITPYDIHQAIREFYSNEFLGIAITENDGDTQYMRVALRSDGDVDRFIPAHIAVSGNTGTTVSLDKLVTVTHVEANPRSYFRINSLNSVYLNITSDDGANQLLLAQKIRTAMAAFKVTMPEGYSIDQAYDATETISEELDKIYFRTGLTMLILLLFVCLVTLNLRYVLLLTISLSVNIAVAVVFYYLTRIEIQLYSLAGITISLNLIIDNLVVMTDHYTRRHNQRAFTAILAATATTIGALSVVYFMDENTRLSLEDFVTVVIINLTVSLIVALLLIPALVDRLGVRLFGSNKIHQRNWRRQVSLFLSRIYAVIVRLAVKYRVLLVIIAILAFGLPVFMLPEKIEGDGFWIEKYNATFGSQTYKDKIRPIVDPIFGGTLRLFVEKVYDGFYWHRNESEPIVYINATLPTGSTLQQMDALIRKMESTLKNYSEISQFQTYVLGARRAFITVMFRKDHWHNGTPYRIKAEIISKAHTLGGGSWSVYGLDDQGFNNDVRASAGSYCVQLTGYNYDELSYWAYVMRDSLLASSRINEVTITAEFSQWKDDYTEFHLVLNRDKLAKEGLTVSQIFEAIKPTFGRDIDCGRITVDRSAQSIILSSAQSKIYDIFTLMRQPFSVGEKTFNLVDLATIEKRQASQDIVKKNQQYNMALQYEYIGPYKQGDKSLNKAIKQINSVLPVGYKAQNGRQQWQENDDGSKYWLLLLVIAIIFFTTAILFNSLLQPLAIIFIIPVSFIGIFATFYLFGLKFDQGGFASFILLAGITVNAAIYILNEYNSLRTHYPYTVPNKLYLRAFRVKIVPILLTILSTILGFIPFVIGESKESFWFPLATGTMGGLVVSLLAIFFVLPVFILPRQKNTPTND